MSVDRKHGLYAVNAGSTVVGGITSQAIRTGTEIRRNATSGEVYPRWSSLVAQNPGASFATVAIASAIDSLVTLSQMSLSIAGLTGGLKLYAQQHAEGGTRTAGSNHRIYTIVEGLIIPRQITINHQGDAELGFDVAATWDGTNDPIQFTDSSALPTMVDDDERFTIGAATLESVSIPEITSISIDLGVAAHVTGADSDIWPTHASVMEIGPVITIGGIDVERLKAANIPLTGKAVTHANSTVYLRKRAEGGTFVADGTAEHISITAAGMMHVENAFDASGNELASADLILNTTFDGTNAPLVIDTTAAIS